MADAALRPAEATPESGDDWQARLQRPPAPDAGPVLSVDGFEGPLDWLLELARARRIDLARLSLLELIGQFEAAMVAVLADRTLGVAGLARCGDWLVMAADLTLLRSRLLLPASSAETRAAKDAAEALRRQLLDRAHAVSVADWLERRPWLGRDVFARGGSERTGIAPGRRGGALTELLRACLAAIRLPADAAARYQVPLRRFWTVADAITRIRGLLPGLPADGAGLTALLPPVPADAPEHDMRCRMALAATFGGVLELARAQSLCVAQDSSFGPLRVIGSQPPPN